MFQERRDHPHEGLDGDGDRRGAQQTGGVHPNRAAFGVDEWATGEPGTHGNVRLDVTVEMAASRAGPRFAEGGDHAHAGPWSGARPCDRQCEVSDFQTVGWRSVGGGKTCSLHAQDGDVGRRIPTDQRGVGRRPIGEPDMNVVISFDRVVRGNDCSVRRPDDAACGYPSTSLDTHNGRRGFRNGFGECIRKAGQSFGHGVLLDLSLSETVRQLMTLLCRSSPPPCSLG